MNKLVRDVRFSINPFLASDVVGANSYAGKRSGDGLAIFLELSIGLVGSIDNDTGFLINITDIDETVRRIAVPIFTDEIRCQFKASRHIDICQLHKLLQSIISPLKRAFANCFLADLTLKFSPFKKIAIDCEDSDMIYFSEKFDFAAMHKLYNDKFSEAENIAMFGKCANANGHGHNYIVEVTVKYANDTQFRQGDFDQTVKDNLIELLDHKNLNIDVEGLANINPTIENISVFAWENLVGQFGDIALHSIGIWESDRAYCTYYG